MPSLFAEADPVSWNTLISATCAIATAGFAWLTARDKSKNDKRVTALETNVMACDEERTNLRRMYDALVTQLRAVGVLPPDPPKGP